MNSVQFELLRQFQPSIRNKRFRQRDVVTLFSLATMKKK